MSSGRREANLELRGEISGELGRDRTPPAVSVQIVCPAVQGDYMPRVVFGAEGPDDTGLFQTVGPLQRRG